MNNSYSELIYDWERFYENLFDTEFDFTKIRIPPKPTDGSWLLLIIVDLTLEQLWAKYEQFLPGSWKSGLVEFGGNLDETVVENKRGAKESAYAVWVKDITEASYDHGMNISADMADEHEIESETLAERLIHGLKVFEENGKHLDSFESVTLCAGSRTARGCVPCVHFDTSASGRGIDLFDCDPDIALCDHHIREVVC